MSSFPVCADVLPPTVSLVPVSEVATRLGVSVSRVHQQLRDRQLIAVRRSGVAGVPADFFATDGTVLRFLAGLISVLTDGGYAPAEILRWLYTPDESLAGPPVAALHGHSAREVVRRAQALAF
ncbi:Rv2175c family DNA-binding protein [Skermania piniformis]|uniref:DNA-binding protein n=1 Tax=Skermania pinensis TaxID=39122 RepID=A0ABX8SHC0_9ACTN|nr:Rv2175c family DNA-binding protein [Skermania piniformis]QXQ15076.1 DNA-binding protein [Skermania piniformis]